LILVLSSHAPATSANSEQEIRGSHQAAFSAVSSVWDAPIPPTKALTTQVITKTALKALVLQDILNLLSLMLHHPYQAGCAVNACYVNAFGSDPAAGSAIFAVFTATRACADCSS
jgi:hypothetical protein